jgi:hypothetical protein
VALVNMQRWLAEHGAAGAASPIEGNSPNPSDPAGDPSSYIAQLEATVAYQTELIEKLQDVLRIKVEEENRARAAQIPRQVHRSRVIRKPRALPERK